MSLSRRDWFRLTSAGALAPLAVATHSALVKRELGIPQERLMVCGISFGYEDASHRANGYRTTRALLDEAVAWIDA